MDLGECCADADPLFFDLPSAKDQLPQEPEKKKEGGSLEVPEIDVIDAGFIARAPIPMDQVERLERASKVAEGVYYVELMRKRLKCIWKLQDKWINRTCNKKNPKHVEIQTRLRDFSAALLSAFEAQFGPMSSAMADVSTRKHQKTDRKKREKILQ